jgi:pimeloyl-ACP methyl ester carboxylesterase
MRLSGLLCLALATACASPPRPFAGVLATSSGDLWVTAHGAGPTLVLLHGLGDSGVGWRKIDAPLLAAGYRLVIPDALGAGRSDKRAGLDLRLPAHATRLHEVIERLCPEPVVLVGNSLGGTLALLYAQRHPERVRALVLLDPAAYAEGTERGRWLFALPDLTAEAMHLMGPRLLARVGLALNFADGSRIADEDFDVYSAEASRSGAIEAFLAQQQALAVDPAELDAFERGHREISCPVLIVWGRRDRVLPVRHAWRLRGDLPDARLVVLDDVGHTPQLEASGRVVAEMVAFLRALR